MHRTSIRHSYTLNYSSVNCAGHVSAMSSAYFAHAPFFYFISGEMNRPKEKTVERNNRKLVVEW